MNADTDDRKICELFNTKERKCNTKLNEKSTFSSFVTAKMKHKPPY